MSGVDSANDDVVQPVRASARRYREAIQRADRLTAALEAIRDHATPGAFVGDVADALADVRRLATAALEEQP